MTRPNRAGEVIAIRQMDDVALVCQRVRALARAAGFDAFGAAALVTAAAEVAWNTLTHGGGGEATVTTLDDGGRAGVSVAFRDHGPGFTEASRRAALVDPAASHHAPGEPSGASATSDEPAADAPIEGPRVDGLGLVGCQRFVDAVVVDAPPEGGAYVSLIKWAHA